MNCPNCNKLLKPTQKFCPACGTRIMPQEQESNSQQTQNEQPTLQYGTTGEPVSMPSEPSFEQSPENIENSFNQEPPSAPPKKKNNIVVIIVIAGAALLLIAGGIFAAMKLFGSKDDGKKDDKAPSSVSDTVDKKGHADSAPSSAGDPNAVVKRFEKALNDNDESEMQALFTPEGRETKAKTAFSVVYALNNLTQQTLTYKCELENLEYGDGEETASGNIKISADLPVVGTQSTSPKASFKKIDGEWYIDLITLA